MTSLCVIPFNRTSSSGAASSGLFVRLPIPADFACAPGVLPVHRRGACYASVRSTGSLCRVHSRGWLCVQNTLSWLARRQLLLRRCRQQPWPARPLLHPGRLTGGACRGRCGALLRWPLQHPHLHSHRETVSSCVIACACPGAAHSLQWALKEHPIVNSCARVLEFSLRLWACALVVSLFACRTWRAWTGTWKTWSGSMRTC